MLKPLSHIVDNAFVYHPFGMVMFGRMYTASTTYKFGYQGSLKDEEITVAGGTYNTFFRELNVRIGNWYSIDPKNNAYEASYISMRDNPIWYIDINGDAAWIVNHKWNAHYISMYRKESEQIAKQLQKDGKRYTCEDFAITVVATFAMKHNLPFKWETNSKSFDASSNAYNDFSSFIHDVKLLSGAPDFKNKKNTIETPLSNMRKGDIIALAHNSNNIAHHIQLVTLAAQNEKGGPMVFVTSGNFHYGAIRHLGSNDPNSSRYYGTTPQSGFWDIKRDYFYNETTGKRTSNFSKSEKLSFNRFNFMQWN